MDFIFYINFPQILLLLKLSSVLSTALSTLTLACPNWEWQRTLFLKKRWFSSFCVFVERWSYICPPSACSGTTAWEHHNLWGKRQESCLWMREQRWSQTHFLDISPSLPTWSLALLKWILSHLAFTQASNSVGHKQWDNMRNEANNIKIQNNEQKGD